MTTQVLQRPAGAGRWQSLRHELARIPWHGLRHNGNQALITFAACYAGAMFSMQHNVFPWWVAVPLAGGFEWTYLAGIALASDIRKGLWAILISATAMITSAAFGMLNILGVYTVIPDHPDPLAAAGLAAAHIIPITLMSFFYAMAHRAHRAQALADTAAQQQRKEAIEDEQRLLTDTWRREKLAIEIERERINLERARLRLARSSANSGATNANTPPPQPPTAAGTATNTARTPDREHLKAQIASALREQPKRNRSELARTLGIGRTLLYELIGEIEG
jgi:hypothetical protein